jgi:hypothetical protein
VSMPRPGRRVGPVAGLVVGLVVSGALLAGCGDAHPGVAVQAGDQTVSVDEVDTLAKDFCTVLAPQLKSQQEPQTLPLSYLRGGIAGLLAQRAVAEQLAEQYDVEPGELYEKKVSDVRASVSTLDENVQDAVVTVQSTGNYVEGIEAAVGEKLLAAEGTTDAQFSDKVKRGQRAFNDWVDEHGVRFDPEFGVEMDNGQVKSVDTSVSYAVGEAAKQGAAQQPDQTYAKSLPSAHTCG